MGAQKKLYVYLGVRIDDASLISMVDIKAGVDNRAGMERIPVKRRALVSATHGSSASGQVAHRRQPERTR